METQLSEGAVKRMLNNIEVEDPILQVLTCKTIQCDNKTWDYCILSLSDGSDKIELAMFPSPLLDGKKLREKIDPNTIIRVKRYIQYILLDFEICGNVNPEARNTVKRAASPENDGDASPTKQTVLINSSENNFLLIDSLTCGNNNTNVIDLRPCLPLPMSLIQIY